MVPSVTLASVPVIEHYHPILVTLGGHRGQVKIIIPRKSKKVSMIFKNKYYLNVVFCWEKNEKSLQWY